MCDGAIGVVGRRGHCCVIISFSSFLFLTLLLPPPPSSIQYFRAIHLDFLHRNGGIDVRGIGISLGLPLLWSSWPLSLSISMGAQDVPSARWPCPRRGPAMATSASSSVLPRVAQIRELDMGS